MDSVSSDGRSIPGLRTLENRLNGPKSLENRDSHQNRFLPCFLLANLSISSHHIGDVWVKFQQFMLFEVKISDQYVNILSILRGKPVNIQYQYLEGRESIFLMSLTEGPGRWTEACLGPRASAPNPSRYDHGRSHVCSGHLRAAA